MTPPARPARPAHGAARRRLGGLTLIELMVALAVFAVLGTLTYRGTGQLLDGRAAIDHQLERWREIDRALQIIETELLQVVAPSRHDGPAPPAGTPAAQTAAARAVTATTNATTNAPALRWRSGGDWSKLDFLGMAGGTLVERITFRHFEGRIDWIRHADAQGAAYAETDVLIERITGLRARFFDAGRWGNAWPRPNTLSALPQAVEIQLDLPDQGTITRFYALR